MVSMTEYQRVRQRNSRKVYAMVDRRASTKEHWMECPMVNWMEFRTARMMGSSMDRLYELSSVAYPNLEESSFVGPILTWCRRYLRLRCRISAH
jgi:hypothetical protein